MGEIGRRLCPLVMAAWLLVSVGCGEKTECGEFPLDDRAKKCVVDTVDAMVQETYPFAEYKGVDLELFSQSLRATLKLEGSDEVFLTKVAEAVSSLRDGHTRVERRRLENPGVAPLDVRVIDEEVVVVGVDDARMAAYLGERILAIDGVPAKQALRSVRGWVETSTLGEAHLQGVQLALAGEAGEAVELTFADGSRVELKRRSIFAEPYSEMVQGFGYLKIDTFGFIDDMERIDQALNEVMDSEGLIIDLRGNGGGYPSVTDGLFGRLVGDDVDSFYLVKNNGEVFRELKLRSRGETFDGPVVVLVDPMTYSASNYFAHRMLYHKRGALIGERTGGGAASPQRGVMLLPGVWFQVSTHVLMPPSGQHSESGLEPTVKVGGEEKWLDEERTSGLTAHPDPVLREALRYLKER